MKQVAILKQINQYLLLGISYVMLSLLIGEWHPFSLEDMYNTFPNTAYSFFITDKQGQLLAVKKYYNYNVDDMTHNFYAIGEQTAKTKNGLDDVEAIGKKMAALLNQHLKSTLPCDSVQLHLLTYFLQNHTLCSKDQIITTYACH